MSLWKNELLIPTIPTITAGLIFLSSFNPRDNYPTAQNFQPESPIPPIGETNHTIFLPFISLPSTTFLPIILSPSKNPLTIQFATLNTDDSNPLPVTDQLPPYNISLFQETNPEDTPTNTQCVTNGELAICSNDPFTIESTSSYSIPNDRNSPRSLFCAEISHNGNPLLTVCNVHLHHINNREQREILKTIIDEKSLIPNNQKLIIAGDFNATPDQINETFPEAKLACPPQSDCGPIPIRGEVDNALIFNFSQELNLEAMRIPTHNSDHNILKFEILE